MPLIEDYIQDVTPGFVIVPDALHDNVTGYLPEVTLEPRGS